MESQQSFTIQQNFRQFAGINDLNYIPFPNNQFNQIYNNQKTNINSTKASNDRSTADADSFSYQNNNYNYEKLKNSENRIILKKSNEFVNELFKAFGEKNS